MIKTKQKFLISIFILLPLILRANPNTESKQVPSPELSLAVEQKQFLTLTIENDKIGDGTDQNYTSGILLTYFDSGYRPEKLARWLNKNLPMVPFNNITKISYSIGQ